MSDVIERRWAEASDPWPWRTSVPFGLDFHITDVDARLIAGAPADIATLIRQGWLERIGAAIAAAAAIWWFAYEVSAEHGLDLDRMLAKELSFLGLADGIPR